MTPVPSSIRFRRPGRAELAQLIRDHGRRPLSYEAVGISLSDSPPPRGWGVSSGSVHLGTGPQVWERGQEAIRTWAAHRGAGITVEPADAPLQVGGVVAVAAGLPFGAIAGLCRIVAVVDEPDRFGFAYGTVPPHPEVGEESFLLERDPTGAVSFTARSVSRAVALPARLAPPLARLAIAAYTRVYARSVRRTVQR